MEKQEQDVEDKSQAAKDHTTDQETVTALGLKDLPERNTVAIKIPPDSAWEKWLPWALVLGKNSCLGPLSAFQSSWGHPTRHRNVGEVSPKVTNLVKT